MSSRPGSSGGWNSSIWKARLPPCRRLYWAGWWWCPWDLLRKLMGESVSAPGNTGETQAVAARARSIVIEVERSLGFEPVDREREKLGYDIRAAIPTLEKLRFIEVKGRVTGAETITVTRNEILYSLNKPDSFILAIVEFFPIIPTGSITCAVPSSGNRTLVLPVSITALRNSWRGRRHRHDKICFIISAEIWGSFMKYRKKLIEVALPLDAINKASAREKSIRHGHPSTLHLWWARRPLAAARAVIFAQMVDDPSTYVDVLKSDPRKRRRAASILQIRRKAWEEAKEVAQQAAAANIPAPEPGPEPTLDEVLAELERERLFQIIEELVQWENTNNEEVLQRAREEIWQSWRRACADNADHPRARELFDRHKLPAFHDPFAGGGSLPLEAQRLGLEAYASDLNPVAVLINKAMIDSPPNLPAARR